MTREKATKIVSEYLKEMNPDMWDGYGVKPPSFDDMIYEYPLTDEVRLEIVFIYDEEDGWHYCCDLVYRTSNESIYMLSGYGIDSSFNLANTIEEICNIFNKTVPEREIENLNSGYEKSEVFESIILEKEEYGEFEWKLLEKLFTESKEVSIIKLNMTSVETFAE